MDDAGDYVFGGGRGDYLVNTPEAVAQSVMTRLALETGEWFTDTTDGTPYATQVLGERAKPLYDAAIRRRILGTTGVLEITDYSSELDANTRRLTIAATITTAYGTTTVTGTV